MAIEDPVPEDAELEGGRRSAPPFVRFTTCGNQRSISPLHIQENVTLDSKTHSLDVVSRFKLKVPNRFQRLRPRSDASTAYGSPMESRKFFRSRKNPGGNRQFIGSPMDARKSCGSRVSPLGSRRFLGSKVFSRDPTSWTFGSLTSTNTNVTLTSRLLGEGAGKRLKMGGSSFWRWAWRRTPPRPSSLHPGRMETTSLLQKFTTETATEQKPASKVRVTFYECSKPLVVTSPEPSDYDQYSPQDLIMASPLSDASHLPPAFDRQLSSESGRDNPFRPDGDISREADEIVQLIKSGRPLQNQPGQRDTTDSLDSGLMSPDGKEASSEPLISANDASPRQQQLPSPLTVPIQPTTGATTTSSPVKAGANGSAAPDSTPGTVEVTHATVKPTDAAHVEHVVLKKKSKCSCCVIQ